MRGLQKAMCDNPLGRVLWLYKDHQEKYTEPKPACTKEGDIELRSSPLHIFRNQMAQPDIIKACGPWDSLFGWDRDADTLLTHYTMSFYWGFCKCSRKWGTENYQHTNFSSIVLIRAKKSAQVVLGNDQIRDCCEHGRRGGLAIGLQTW